MTVQKYGDLTAEERRTWTDELLHQLLAPSPWPRPEYLPVPWYGRLRQRLAAPIYWFSYRVQDVATTVSDAGDAVFAVARAVHYHQREKRPLHVGTTVTFRKWAPLTPATQSEPDALD